MKDDEYKDNIKNVIKRFVLENTQMNAVKLNGICAKQKSRNIL